MRQRAASRRVAALCLIAALAAPARADDLREALVAAYATNPALASARDQLRGTDAGVALARADGLPSASGSAQEEEYPLISALNFFSPRRQVTLSGTLNVPVYSGGAVRNAVAAARTRVSAGQDDLGGTESAVFSQAVAVYMDVLLNETVVRFNRANVEMLKVNLQATHDRYQIGDLTRTDVAQSQSRLALAEGQLRGAEANLVSAREQYIQIIGKAPAGLAPPPPLPGLPASADEAVNFALDHNPDLAAARQRSRAAHLDTNAAHAGLLPKLGLFADAGYTDALGTLAPVPGFGILPQTSTSGDFGVRATIPIYQGGRPTAQIRQAQARESAALDGEIGTERQVIAQTRAAFSSWTAANEIIVSSQTALDAARLSLEGVKAENSVGNRTILDILNAEQEMVNAEVQLETARRNAYVAGFSLLAAMGRARAADLGLDGGALYDPNVHYRAVAGDLSDWGGDPKPRATATRTVDTPAQGSSIPGQ